MKERFKYTKDFIMRQKAKREKRERKLALYTAL